MKIQTKGVGRIYLGKLSRGWKILIFSGGSSAGGGIFTPKNLHLRKSELK